MIANLSLLFGMRHSAVVAKVLSGRPRLVKGKMWMMADLSLFVRIRA
jgi:hypothetical protein